MTGRWGSLVSVVLIAGVLGGCKSQAATPAQLRPADESPAVRVGSVPTEVRTIPRTLEITGTLLANQQSDVTPIVGGRVVEVLVERGSVVEEGAPLIRLRDVDYRMQMSAAQAQLEGARARLGLANDTSVIRAEDTAEARTAQVNRELAESTFHRAETLHEHGAMSDADRDRAYASFVAAREQYQSTLNGMRGAVVALQSARVALQQGQTAVRESLVRAPFAGEIADRFVDVGEYVTPAMRIVSLVATHPLRLEVQIPQEQIGLVQRGQAIEVRVDTYPDRVFHGEVHYISAAVRQDTRGLTVEAIVPNDDGALRPGLFAKARIMLAGTQDVIAVPAAAVLDNAGTHRVFVIENGRVTEHVVTIEDRTEETVLVRDGVPRGARVATGTLDRLSDGQRVQN